MNEFIDNLMRYCYQLDKHTWPYAVIELNADGSGHITYNDKLVFSWRNKQYWEEDNKVLLEKMNK